MHTPASNIENLRPQGNHFGFSVAMMWIRRARSKIPLITEEIRLADIIGPLLLKKWQMEIDLQWGGARKKNRYRLYFKTFR